MQLDQLTTVIIQCSFFQTSSAAVTGELPILSASFIHCHDYNFTPSHFCSVPSAFRIIVCSSVPFRSIPWNSDHHFLEHIHVPCFRNSHITKLGPLNSQCIINSFASRIFLSTSYSSVCVKVLITSKNILL